MEQERNQTFIERIPLDIFAGFGAYFLLTRVGALLLTLLLALFGARASQNPTAYMLIQAVILIAGVSLGAAVAGGLAKERGPNRGLFVAVTIVLFDAAALLIQILGYYMTTGNLTGFRLPGEGIGIAIDPITWFVILVAGWIAGGYGETLVKGKPSDEGEAEESHSDTESSHTADTGSSDAG